MGKIHNTSNIKVVVFDLDDTLYSELDYVRSGLAFVANTMSDILEVMPSDLLSKLLESLQIGRSNIFDRALNAMSLKSARNIKQCVALYRAHIPEIELYHEALNVISELAKKYPIYIVTDGNKLVQERKLRALGLYDSQLIKKAYITYRYGLKNTKPSPYCFNKIALKEQVNTSEIIYIGDNPQKDFVGIKPLGYKTIRILSGQHKDCYYGDVYEAEYIVNNLSDILPIINAK